MVKNEKRQAAAKKAAKKNPWIQHVKQVAKERALSYKLGLANSKDSYKKSMVKNEPKRGKESLHGAAPIKKREESPTIIEKETTKKLKNKLLVKTEKQPKSNPQHLR